MRVLFVAFEFPPLGGGGVHRSIGFAKYLPAYGIQPIVLTTDLPSFQQAIANPIDETLLHDLSTDLVIERVPCLPENTPRSGKLAAWLRLFFSLVEPQAKWWQPYLEQHLPRVMARYRPELIYVSLPPMGMGPQWATIARELGLPLLLDFRDAWSQWQTAPYPTWAHYRLTVRLEGRCLQSAARVICTSEQTRKDLLALHPSIGEERIVTITNGYDAEVSDWSLSSPSSPGRATDRHVVGYVGSFYYSPSARKAMLRPWWRKRLHQVLQYASRKEDWLYRSPYFFFRTVERLVTRRADLRHKLKIRFAGCKPSWLDEQIQEFGLQDLVYHDGYLSHEEALAFQKECDSLLITSAKVIGADDYSIAGKTFEYFVARKPILGFVTEGAQRDILRKSGMAMILNPDDVETSAARLETLIDGEIVLTPNENFLRTLHRRELTGRLADAMRQAKACAT